MSFRTLEEMKEIVDKYYKFVEDLFWRGYLSSVIISVSILGLTRAEITLHTIFRQIFFTSLSFFGFMYLNVWSSGSKKKCTIAYICYIVFLIIMAWWYFK